MKKKLLTTFKNGLPFDTVLAKNLDAMLNRVKNKKAVMIIIDGEQGEGKTTLSVHCGDYLNGAYTLKDEVYNRNENQLLNLKETEQFATGGEEFVSKLLKCYNDRKPVIIYDEGGDFTSRGAQSRFNHRLNRVFEVFRAFKVIVILTLPLFESLDRSLIDKGIPRLLLHCVGRKKTFGVCKAYSLYRMSWIHSKMKKMVGGSKKIVYRQYPNFYFRFRPLPTTRQKQLDKLSVQGKEKELRKQSGSIKGLVTVVELTRKFNRSKVWVYKSLKKSGVKPVETHKKVHYYNESVIKKLERV